MLILLYSMGKFERRVFWINFDFGFDRMFWICCCCCCCGAFRHIPASTFIYIWIWQCVFCRHSAARHSKAISKCSSIQSNMMRSLYLSLWLFFLHSCSISSYEIYTPSFSNWKIEIGVIIIKANYKSFEMNKKIPKTAAKQPLNMVVWMFFYFYFWKITNF